jgi:hypothetical protein
VPGEGFFVPSKCFFETGPTRLATLRFNQLSVRSQNPLGESTPVAVIVGRRNGKIPFRFIELALPPNAVANFVTKTL